MSNETTSQQDHPDTKKTPLELFVMLKRISSSAGPALLTEGMEVAKQMGHAELDPAHLVVAALRDPKNFAVAKLFARDYRMTESTASEVVSAAFPQVQLPITSGPIPNEAMERLMEMAPTIAKERASLRHETPYPTAYDIGMAALAAESDVIDMLTAMAVAEAIGEGLTGLVDTSIHPD